MRTESRSRQVGRWYGDIEVVAETCCVGVDPGWAFGGFICFLTWGALIGSSSPVARSSSSSNHILISLRFWFVSVIDHSPHYCPFFNTQNKGETKRLINDNHQTFCSLYFFWILVDCFYRTSRCYKSSSISWGRLEIPSLISATGLFLLHGPCYRPVLLHGPWYCPTFTHGICSALLLYMGFCIGLLSHMGLYLAEEPGPSLFWHMGLYLYPAFFGLLLQHMGS